MSIILWWAINQVGPGPLPAIPLFQDKPH